MPLRFSTCAVSELTRFFSNIYTSAPSFQLKTMPEIARFLPWILRRPLSRALQAVGYKAVPTSLVYQLDGLSTVHSARFRKDPRFQAAWQRALQASHGVDSGMEWRIHVGLWAASLAARVPGEFVECGVNAGFLSSAILCYLDWANLGKTFYLVDTFAGPVLEQFSAKEIARGNLQKVKQSLAAGAYVTDLHRVRQNYAEWERIEIVQGVVPQILPSVDAQALAFLHIDMNCAHPEIEALRFFWDRLSTGGIVLLDDYAHYGYDSQGDAMDALAAMLGCQILTLPTGQGMIVK
jgi:hypothetical protein